MATVKSYTDISQSRKLAEFLPIESADAFYVIGKEPVDIITIFGFVTHEHLREQIAYKRAIPCWSLASLLGVLPDYTLQTNTDGTVFVVCESKKPMISDAYDSPVDACATMIEKLHELNLL